MEQKPKGEIICMATQQGGAEIMYDKCPTVTASAGMSGNNQPVVCLATFEGNGCRPSHKGLGLQQGGREIYTLNATEVHGVITERRKEHMESDYEVRRLTPTECAALQGFPTDWCADVPHSDSSEYKLWGNGIALPSILPFIQNAVGHIKELRKDGIIA